MKKRFGIILIVTIIFALCSCRPRTVYVDTNGVVIERNEVHGAEVSDYFRRDVLIITATEEIYVDRNTDVLYYVYNPITQKYGITPIMKPDGTCLTYTEWKSYKGTKE